MPKFKYIGGKTHSEYHSEREGVDEREGVEMPDSVTAFGHKFLFGQPVEVKRSAFREDDHFDHALSKLRKNKYFEEVPDTVEDAVVVDETPAPKRGRKPAIEAVE